MKKNKYTIRRKNIAHVKLVSLTGQTWYDANENLIKWSDLTDSTITNGLVVYNISGGTVNEGYYKWGIPTGDTWNLVVGTGTTQQDIQNDINRQPALIQNVGY